MRGSMSGRSACGVTNRASGSVGRSTVRGDDCGMEGMPLRNSLSRGHRDPYEGLRDPFEIEDPSHEVPVTNERLGAWARRPAGRGSRTAPRSQGLSRALRGSFATSTPARIAGPRPLGSFSTTGSLMESR